MNFIHIDDFQIMDDLGPGNAGAVEVNLTLVSGERRWCFFMTPEKLSQVGDWIEGTKIRIHYGSPHMIVVAAPLTKDLITKVFLELDKKDLIRECTLSI